MLDRKQSELGTAGGSYAVILLLLPLVSLTIAKFNGLSVYCSVVAHFSALYVYYFRISCPYIIACMWTIYVNVTILRKYSGNGHVCTSSQNQAVSLLPCGLGMRLMQTLTSFKICDGHQFPSRYRKQARSFCFTFVLQRHSSPAFILLEAFSTAEQCMSGSQGYTCSNLRGTGRFLLHILCTYRQEWHVLSLYPASI